MGPKFDKGKAALLNFASALEHPLSPASVMSGVPDPTGDIVEKIEAAQLVFGGSTTSVNDGGMVTGSARNLLNDIERLFNRRGPFEAYTVHQTATLRDVSFMLFWSSKKWVASEPVYTPVDGPLPGGGFPGPQSAASAAAAALKAQLGGGP